MLVPKVQSRCRFLGMCWKKAWALTIAPTRRVGYQVASKVARLVTQIAPSPTPMDPGFRSRSRVRRFIGFTFYRDTFLLDIRGWGKGLVSINGHNLGRYWRISVERTPRRTTSAAPASGFGSYQFLLPLQNVGLASSGCSRGADFRRVIASGLTERGFVPWAGR